MIRNYLTVALRNIMRNKLTSFINIVGLAIAMTCAVLIYYYVTDELGYDRYNTHIDRTFRIGRDFMDATGADRLRLSTVAPPVGPLMKTDFGEIELMARTIQSSFVIGLEENGELKKSVSENNIYMVEPDIFKIFDFNILSGDAASSLTRPFTIMLTPEAARKYFGTDNVIGKRLRGDDKFDLEVTGLFKRLPPQSHWHPEFLISFSTLEDSTVYGRRGLETNWSNNAFNTYVLLQNAGDRQKLQDQLPAFLDRHFGPYAIKMGNQPANFVASKRTRLNVQKVADVHLRSHLDDELEPGGSISNVYMIGTIGVFIILIACFNFVNLSTARATQRAKEVGLRKVAGAFRDQLIRQYLSESVLLALLALLLSIALAALALPWLNSFTGKELSFDFLNQPQIPLGLFGFAVVVGVLAGIYPAFVISAYKPALVLKSEQGMAAGKGGIRKALVVAQFAISITLIIATIVTADQLEYLTTRDLGYNKEMVITLPYYGELTSGYTSFYNELLKSSTIKNASRSSRVPTGRLLDSYGAAQIVNGDSAQQLDINLKSISVDEEFFATYGIKMAAGRSFSKSIPTDDSLGFVINEACARAIGWKNLQGEIGREFQYANVKGKLLGITGDFHFESLHQSIIPIAFLVRNDNYNVLSIAIDGKNSTAGIEYAEKVWKEFLPKRPFDFQFISEKYARLYDAEQKQHQLFTIFSAMAIFIACLGLFGLATFNTMLRVKEIGIRKVLGASVPSILTLLSREIILLIVAANLIAWPLAGYLMNGWLSSFAYHVSMNPLIFLGAAVAAIVMSLITVSFQTVKAAMGNPAQTLRRE